MDSTELNPSVFAMKKLLFSARMTPSFNQTKVNGGSPSKTLQYKAARFPNFSSDGKCSGATSGFVPPVKVHK